MSTNTYNIKMKIADNTTGYSYRTFQILSSTPTNRLVIPGSSGIAYSYDGITWNYTSGYSGYDCEFGNNYWIVTTNNSTQDLIRSTDGISWTTITPTISVGSFTNFSLTNHKIWKIRYRNSKWMAMTSQHNGYVFYMESTNNGANWAIIGQYLNGSASTGGIFNFDYANGIWNAAHNSFGIIHSTDGITWTLLSSNLTIDQTIGQKYTTTYSNMDIGYDNGIWIATSYNTTSVANRIVLSYDGKEFFSGSLGSTNGTSYIPASGIYYDSGYFYLIWLNASAKSTRYLSYSASMGEVFENVSTTVIQDSNPQSGPTFVKINNTLVYTSLSSNLIYYSIDNGSSYSSYSFTAPQTIGIRPLSTL